MYRVNDRLRALRAAAGFKTAKEFSDTHGFAQQTYSAHERGAEAGGRGLKRAVAEVYISCLSQKLPGATVEWLLYGEGRSPLGKATAAFMPKGLSEDAVPYWYGETAGAPDKPAKDSIIDALYPGRTNADIWSVETSAMNMEGVLPGDLIITDLGLSAKDGDMVLAQQTDQRTGKTQTLLRRYAPPFLLARSTDCRFDKPIIVDEAEVIILAVVVGKVGWLRKQQK